MRRSQRERLFAATVTRVSERGYAPVEVADLLELSGVSRPTFCEMFADKRECFLATMDAVDEIATPRMGRAGQIKRGQEWEQCGRQVLLAFATLVQEQPAAARAFLVDSPAAGDEALRRLESALDKLESVAQVLLEASPQRTAMPPELVTAMVGAVCELAGSRLRQAREGDLPRALDDAAELLLSYRSPPEPLRLSVRPPKQGCERLDAADHADRAIRAFAVAVADNGYAETSIDDVLQRASMSRATFEANFADKQDLMAAAIDSACAQTVAAAVPAFSRVSEWPRGVRGGYGAMLNFLASRPALAHLLTVGVYAAGDEAMERRAAGMAPLQIVLENNTTDRQHLPPVVYEALGGAVAGLMFRTVLRSGTGALPGLAPVCTYLTLAPFLGVEKACEVANGDGSGRRDDRGPGLEPDQR